MSDLSQERRLQYLEKVNEEYTPSEQSWWQHPAPIYYLTEEFAKRSDSKVVAGEAVIFKKAGKDRMVVAVLVTVALLLIYILGKNDFGISHIVILLILLMVILPLLLNNRTVIRISTENIWVQSGGNEIAWQQVMATYIKEAREEHLQYFLIVHFYNATTDSFHRTEIELTGIVSPVLLAATIEAFRNISEQQ